MIASISLGVFKQPVLFLIEQAQLFLVILFRDLEVVAVYKIVPGIVGGIDVDHLHLVQVGVLQEL
jgi:hypothetical protein